MKVHLCPVEIGIGYLDNVCVGRGGVKGWGGLFKSGCFPRKILIAPLVNICSLFF